jgi:CubicO group peptidase (beta-lactamase class C family)
MLPGRILRSCAVLMTLAFPALGGGLSGQQTRQLVLRRKRAGRIVQPSRQLPAVLHVAEGGSAAAAGQGRERTSAHYRFEKQSYSLDNFLAHQRVTGLLVIKHGQILAERYQYDRTATDRFVSQSMAKSIVSLAIGMAPAENKIVSLDDTVAKYVPDLAGNPYGETATCNILRMATGVPFKEVYEGNDDNSKFNWIRLTRRLHRGAARLAGARGGVGHAIPLRVRPDGSADAAIARSDGWPR